MMRGVLVISVLLLCACHRVSQAANELPPPKAYAHFKDRVAAQMLDWGIPWRFPCMNNDTAEECFRFTEPERMRGFWRNNFEDSELCEQRTHCGRARATDFIWLELKSRLPGLKDTPPGGLYAIDFIGRRSEYRGLFGGQAMANKEVIVDRLISISEVEPPRGRPDDEANGRGLPDGVQGRAALHAQF